MFSEYVKSSAQNGKWKFLYKKPDETVVCNKPLNAVEKAENGVIFAEKYLCDFNGGNAVRIYGKAGENVSFVFERFNYERICAQHTYFEFPFSEDTNINVADKTKLVFRAKGRGMKWFRLLSQTDENDTLASSGLLLPSAFPDEHTMQISAYSGIHNYGLSQNVLHVFVEETDKDIPLWHIKNGDGFEIYSPDDICRFKAFFENGIFTVKATDSENAVTFDLNN